MTMITRITTAAAPPIDSELSNALAPLAASLMSLPTPFAALPEPLVPNDVIPPRTPFPALRSVIRLIAYSRLRFHASASVSSGFAGVYGDGDAGRGLASISLGVRPSVTLSYI